MDFKHDPSQLIEVADDDIPQEILDFRAPNQQRAREQKEQRIANLVISSNFLITVNPNISYRELQADQAKKIQVVRQLREAWRKFIDGVKQGRFLQRMKQDLSNANYRTPQVTREEARQEIGNSKGFIHMHGILQFDGRTHLNLNAVMEHFRLNIPSSHGQPYVNVRYFADVAKLVEEYMKKQQTHKPIN